MIGVSKNKGISQCLAVPLLRAGAARHLELAKEVRMNDLAEFREKKTAVKRIRNRFPEQHHLSLIICL